MNFKEKFKAFLAAFTAPPRASAGFNKTSADSATNAKYLKPKSVQRTQTKPVVQPKSEFKKVEGVKTEETDTLDVKTKRMERETENLIKPVEDREG